MQTAIRLLVVPSGGLLEACSNAGPRQMTVAQASAWEQNPAYRWPVPTQAGAGTQRCNVQRPMLSATSAPWTAAPMIPESLNIAAGTAGV